MGNFICISRKITEHWVWQDAEYLKWWIDLLILANDKDSKVLAGGEMIQLQKGQLLTSIRSLSERWAITDKRGCQIRKPSPKRVLDFLRTLEQEMMIKRQNWKQQISIITICNYERYEVEKQTSGNAVGNAVGNRVAPPKQERELTLFGFEEIPKQKPKAKPTKHHYAPEVMLTESEYSKLVQAYGEDGAKWMIAKLDDYKAARGTTYKSDYRAILNWVVREYQRQVNQNQNGNQTSWSTDQADAKRQRDAEFARHIAEKLRSDGLH